jgi:hypothetical protein
MVENLTSTLDENLEEKLANSNKIQQDLYCLKTSMCAWNVVSIV